MFPIKLLEYNLIIIQIMGIIGATDIKAVKKITGFIVLFCEAGNDSPTEKPMRHIILSDRINCRPAYSPYPRFYLEYS